MVKMVSSLSVRHMNYLASSHCLVSRIQESLMGIHCIFRDTGYHGERKTPSQLPAKHCWSPWLPVLLASAWSPDAFQLLKLLA